MRKRLLSALLAMAMVLTMLPMSAFATGETGGGETATIGTLEAGFEMEAAKAEEKLGIDRKKDDSSTWCDPKTMYVLIKGVALNDKYTLKVTHTKEDGSSEDVYTEPQFTVAQSSVDRGFSRVYFSFDKTTKPEGETHSTATINLAAGVYTFSVTKDGVEEPLTTSIELVEENGSFKVKEEEVTPPATKAEMVVGYNPLAADAEKALGIDRDTEPSTNWCDDMTMWVKVNGVAKDEVYNLSVTRLKDAATEDVIGADDYTITEAQATRGFARIYFTFDPTVKDDTNHSGAKVDIAAGDYTFTLKKGSEVVDTEKLTLVEDADSKGGFKVGTSEVQEYTITVTTPENGTVTTNPVGKAAADTEVTVTAAPATGYEVDEITVMNGTEKVTVENGKFKMPAANVTVTVTFVKASDPVTEGIAAGFGWTAAEVNTARDAAIKAAGKTDNRENKEDALDQTVWFMVNEPVATTEKGNHYWYEITDGTKVLWEGAMDYEANAAKLGMISTSFLHNGQNKGDEKVPAKLVINVWKTNAAVTAKPATGNPMTQEITTGANPLKIDTVTPNAAEKTVKVTFNQDLLGRYVIELKAGDEVLKSFTTECVAPTPAVAKAEGYTFTDVTLAAGKYTVNVYQAKATTGAVTPAIDSKEVELKAETITEISVEDAAGLSVAVDGNKIVLTGNMKDADKEITLKYKTSADNTGTVKVTYDADAEEGKKWTLGAITLFGDTTYTLDATGVNFLADNVDIVAKDPEVEIKEEIREALTAAGFDAATAVDADATDLLSDAKVDTIIPKSKEDAAALLTADKIDVGETGEAAGDFTEVHVVSYFAVEVVDYAAAKAAEGEKPAEPATITLNITPMVKRVPAVPADGVNPAKHGEFKNEADAAATKLDGYEASEPIVFTVKLPTGFVTNDTKDFVIAKHYADDTKTTVKEWISTTVTEDKGAYTASFNATTFSPYELTVDNRTVNVTFKNGATDVLAADDYDVTNIGWTLPVVAEEDVEDGKEFKGWAYESTATAAAFTDKTLTEALLDAWIAKATAENGTKSPLVLYAVIGDKSSGGGTGPAPGGIGGGSSGTTTYSVNVPTVSNGTVTVNPRNAAKDATVTITVAPDKGYHLESLTVTDKDGNKIELTKVDATKYTFKMPASRVEVKAVFAEGEAPAVSFTDVAEGEYYYDAVKWAVDKGVTNGLTETTFGPNASCTRAQMVTFLWRAAGSPEPTATTTAFTDIDANEYYYKAVLWAVEKGITTGTTETTFSPNATVTRAQTVTFLYRYAGSPAVSGSNNFTDLEAGEYYINAVQWAATNGITTGTTETTFSPANNCTRGQIVTFLYRHIVK